MRHAVPSPAGIDFAGNRLCFDFRDLVAGSFLAGSLDGQLLGGCFVRTAASGDNPEYSRCVHRAAVLPVGVRLHAFLHIVASTHVTPASCTRYTRRYCFAPHAGPVVALARSPFIDGLVLSVADWAFALWLGDSQTPLFVSPFADETYTAGARAMFLNVVCM